MKPSNQNKATLLAASKLGARLFRYQVGLAWVGEIVKKTDELIILKNPRPFKAGVAGVNDEIGFITQTITPDMVGQKIARFVGVEDKMGAGRARTDQKSFIQMVRASGGYAGVSRSDDDVAAILRGEIRD